VLLTRTPLYSPLRAFAYDLHVLSTPPAFVLSQDQTLQLDLEVQKIRSGFCDRCALERVVRKALLRLRHSVFKEPTPSPSQGGNFLIYALLGVLSTPPPKVFLGRG
jgi:hypothetical protein